MAFKQPNDQLFIQTILPVIGASLLVANVHADTFHYENLPVGDRPAGMGMAYTAQTGDTYTMFYNPAGLASVDDKVSATLNAHSSRNILFEDVLEGDNFTTLDLERNSNTIVPGFIGASFTNDLGKFGVSLAVADILYESQSNDTDYQSIEFDDWQGHHYIAIDREYSEIKAGLSWANSTSSGWQFGTTLYGVYTNNKEILLFGDTFSFTDDLDAFNEIRRDNSVRQTDRELALEPKFGLQYHAKHWSVGATIAKRWVVSRELRYESVTSDTSFSIDSDGIADADGFANRIVTSSNKEQRYPLQIAVGGRWQATPALTLALDIRHYEAVSQNVEFANDPVGGVPVVDVTRPLAEVTNLSAGLQWDISDKLSWYAGIYTDNSNLDWTVRRQGAESIGWQRQENIDLLGFASAIEWKYKSYRLSLGFTYAQGDGEAFLGDLDQVSVSNASIVDAEQDMLNLFIGFQY